jgi:hypothetical protein
MGKGACVCAAVAVCRGGGVLDREGELWWAGTAGDVRGRAPFADTPPPPSPSSLGHPDPATALATGAWAALTGGGGGTSSFSLAPAAPLRGGKGGFGSLLRASGRVAKTTNFDACRDLSGRR